MTTNELMLAAIIHAVDDEQGIRRDQWGRYLLFGEAHTRVTTIIDELDNKAALGPWTAAMAIGGLFADIELMAAARELWLEHDGDPWYAGASAKKAAKVIVNAAHARGGGKKAAVGGTDRHAISAVVDAGGAPQNLMPTEEVWLEGYVNGLIRAGITIDPEYVERIVVLDEYGAAGMFDRGRCIVPGFDIPLLGDLKTGTTLEWSQHTIPMQLGAYTHADAIVTQGAATDGSEDRRHPMPEISRERALVIHAPLERPGEVNLWIVDVAAGWEAFKLAAAARAWHQGPGGAWEQLPGELERRLEDSVAAVQEARSAPLRLVPPTTPPEAALRDWLQERIDTIGAHPKARVRLSTTWPKEIPPLRKSDGHTTEELARIESLCDDIERDLSLPFGPSRPSDESKTTADWLQRLLGVFPNSTVQGAQEP